MINVYPQLVRTLLASCYCVKLVFHVTYVRWLVYSRTTSADVGQQFPQLRWGSCIAACRTIVSAAAGDNGFSQIKKQRASCHQLWLHISVCVKAKTMVYQTHAGIKLRNATVARSVELLLGNDLESLEIKLPTSLAGPGPDLPKLILGWLVMAGADRRIATRRSLIHAARYAFTECAAGITSSTDSIVLSTQQQEKLTAQQADLDAKLAQLYKLSHHEAIRQEYVAHDLALTSLPESYCRALASKPSA